MKDPAHIDTERIGRAISLYGMEIGRTRTLEVGCGDGRITEALARRVESLAAVDPSSRAVAVAIRRCARFVNVKIYEGSGAELPFGENTFDVVVFGYSLHHQDGEGALREASRVLRKDGAVVMLEPTMKSEYTRLVALFEEDERERLARTCALIESGILELLSSETYRVEHRFTGFEALYRSLVENHGSFSADDRRNEVAEALGSRASARPLVIVDEVRAFLGRPRP